MRKNRPLSPKPPLPSVGACSASVGERGLKLAHIHTTTLTALLILLILLILLTLLAAPVSTHAQDNPPHDTLLITPTTQGIFPLPETGVTLEIAYATVETPTHITVTRADDDRAFHIAATDANGAPLERFEVPLIVDLGVESGPVIAGWPEMVAVDAASPDAWWAVVFDAHGIYGVPLNGAEPVTLGPLEHFAPNLVGPLTIPEGTLRASDPVDRRIVLDHGDGNVTVRDSAALSARYLDRFIPEDVRNPGGWLLLGSAQTRDLPDIVRALAGRIPPDPDIPAPGVPEAPLPLLLPFDCTEDWVISWGYHHSTPQNRFAVDFSALTPMGTFDQPVVAAHAGTVYLKRFGMPEHMIDTGFTARVVADDDITSTIYGHLDV
ncbi:MAG: hypothetical protein K8S97_11625, partial [Anaerolineae bacterium]|nr:hypothetical protein [Anaerolineae bacterium]